MLQRILRGRLTCTLHVDPLSGDVDGYDFTAPTRFDKLFTGLAAERPKSLPLSDQVSEHYDADETFDADYGQLLDRVYERCVKVLASPTGFEPVFWP